MNHSSAPSSFSQFSTSVGGGGNGPDPPPPQSSSHLFAMSGILVNLALNYYVVLSFSSKLTGAFGTAMAVSIMHMMMVTVPLNLLRVRNKNKPTAHL